MDRPTIYDQFNRPKPAPEINSGEELVEKAGYIPADVQIEDMINAGQRLATARAERFDYAEAKEDDGRTIDPTRSPNFDLADASRMDREVTERLEEVQVAREEKKRKDDEIKKKENDELVELGKKARDAKPAVDS